MFSSYWKPHLISNIHSNFHFWFVKIILQFFVIFFDILHMFVRCVYDLFKCFNVDERWLCTKTHYAFVKHEWTICPPKYYQLCNHSQNSKQESNSFISQLVLLKLFASVSISFKSISICLHVCVWMLFVRVVL